MVIRDDSNHESIFLTRKLEKKIDDFAGHSHSHFPIFFRISRGLEHGIFLLVAPQGYSHSHCPVVKADSLHWL